MSLPSLRARFAVVCLPFLLHTACIIVCTCPFLFAATATTTATSSEALQAQAVLDEKEIDDRDSEHLPLSRAAAELLALEVSGVLSNREFEEEAIVLGL